MQGQDDVLMAGWIRLGWLWHIEDTETQERAHEVFEDTEFSCTACTFL